MAVSRAGQAKVPAAIAGATALGFAAGTFGGVRLASDRSLAGIRLVRRRPVHKRAIRLVRAAVGPGLEAGRIAQRLSGIESELNQLRVNVTPDQRRSPIEVVLGALAHRPGEPR